ncbi:general stress protein [Paenibacillus swuensis]|uniref:General stress protein n=1 Tax=Paenibacillus swuensis TaxID=1178515 RepID=A0A172TL78_9BACL|nr:bacillithiol system redox-active protein YtxJ [Paenibacillus swuensis]ANE47780.1 general stress protein [Paenibacillus swuensis]
MAKWTEITQLNEWEEALERSGEQPLVILKHSTTCPVSSSALEEFDTYLDGTPNENYKYLMVKVIESRPVSNKIAEDLQVKHASPQIILVKNKEQGWNTSHWSITDKHIKAVLD